MGAKSLNSSLTYSMWAEAKGLSSLQVAQVCFSEICGANCNACDICRRSGFVFLRGKYLEAVSRDHFSFTCSLEFPRQRTCLGHAPLNFICTMLFHLLSSQRSRSWRNDIVEKNTSQDVKKKLKTRLRT